MPVPVRKVPIEKERDKILKEYLESPLYNKEITCPFNINKQVVDIYIDYMKKIHTGYFLEGRTHDNCHVNI